MNEFENRVRMHVLNEIVARGERPLEEPRAPTVEEVASELGVRQDHVRAAFEHLAAADAFYLEPHDRTRIRMALPFSPNVPTQLVARAGDSRWYANCAMDALGMSAVLEREIVIHAVNPLETDVGCLPTMDEKPFVEDPYPKRTMTVHLDEKGAHATEGTVVHWLVPPAIASDKIFS